MFTLSNLDGYILQMKHRQLKMSAYVNRGPLSYQGKLNHRTIWCLRKVEYGESVCEAVLSQVFYTNVR